MNMLYDSDDYVVVHHPISEVRHAFEIVDKKNNRELMLDGLWASIFHNQINDWHANIPAQADVEAVLASYVLLAQVPMYVH